MDFLNNIRVIEVNGKFIIEEKIKYYLFFYKWIPLITYRGLNTPYFFETRDGAIESLLREMKQNLL